MASGSRCGPDIAIIGAGLMGRWHAETAHRLGSRVVAVVDADPGRASLLANRFGSRPFTSTDSMLAVLNPVVAHVCTPTETHVASTKRLLDAGCHVLCEKPLAADAANVQLLLDHATTAGLRLCPVHQFVLQRGVNEVVSRLEELGDIRHIGFTFCSAGGQRVSDATLDQVILEIVPHALSVLARILAPTGLSNTSWHTVTPASGELLAIGAVGHTAISMSFSMSARPTQASAVIGGTRATAHIDFFHGFATVMRGHVSRWHKAVRPFKMASVSFAAATLNLAGRAVRMEHAYPGLRQLCSAFYGSIDGTSQPPFSTAEILSTYRARDHVALQANSVRTCEP
jgi:predicted dehydrogenase